MFGQITNRRKIVSSFLLLSSVVFVTPSPARAGGLLEATLPEQLIQEVTLSEQLARAAEQYETQLQQWRNEIQQARMLPQTTFSRVESQLLGLQNVVQGGNALSYAMANLDSQFTARFASAGYAPTTSFASRYAEWSKTAMATTEKTLDAAGYQNSQVQSQAALLQQLQSQASSSEGQNEAIQTGNEIAAEEVNQLLQLRELMMADIQSKAAFQAKQIAEDDEAKRSAGFFNNIDAYPGDYSHR